MRVVLQRVREARVEVAGEIVGNIGHGLLLLVAIAHADREKDADYLADKIVNLRIFEDDVGKMNRSVLDIGGELLAVSQFTLYGDCRRGRRPSFDAAAPAAAAHNLFNYFVNRLKSSKLVTYTGVFQSHMQVYSENDGPVTLLIDSIEN